MIAKVFPSYHPRKGQETHFADEIERALRFGKGKHHTIRFGRRFKANDTATLKQWAGRPYWTEQIVLRRDIKVKAFDIVIDYDAMVILVGGGKHAGEPFCQLREGWPLLREVAERDGLSTRDLLDWFKVGKMKGKHDAQIISWNYQGDYSDLIF